MKGEGEVKEEGWTEEVGHGATVHSSLVYGETQYYQATRIQQERQFISIEYRIIFFLRRRSEWIVLVVKYKVEHRMIQPNSQAHASTNDFTSVNTC